MIHASREARDTKDTRRGGNPEVISLQISGAPLASRFLQVSRRACACVLQARLSLTEIRDYLKSSFDPINPLKKSTVVETFVKRRHLLFRDFITLNFCAIF